MDVCEGTLFHRVAPMLIVFAAFALLVLFLSFATDDSDAAESGRAGNDVDWSYSSTSGTLRITGTGAMWDFSLGGAYGLPGWRDLSIKSVTISEGVTTVGTQAFANSSVTKVTLPSSMKEIHDRAFADTPLARVNLPANLKSVDSYAFCNTNITSITLPEGLQRVGECAFAGTNISSLSIPSSLSSLGAQCFRNTQISNLVIPSTLKSVSQMAFSSTPIQSLIIEEGVLEIYDSAFSNTGIWTLNIPDSVRSIGSYAFGSCKNLMSVTFGAGLTKFPSGIFNDCSSLRSITMGSNMTTLSRGLFSGCTSLTEFYIPARVTALEISPDTRGNAFYGSNIENITVDPANRYFESYDGVLFTKSMGTLVAYPPGRALTSYTIPDSVFSLEDYAFLNARLESLIIPNSVVSIGKGCISIDVLEIPDSVSMIDRDGVSARILTIGDGITELYAYMIGPGIQELKLGAGVSTLGEDLKELGYLREVEVSNRNQTFASLGGIVYDKNIRSIVLIPKAMTGTYVMPNSVEYISAEAFVGIRFTHIVLSENLKAIGGAAFKENQYIRSIKIPASVISIAGEAFYNCRNLEVVYFECSVKPAMGYRSFYIGDAYNWGELRVYSTLPDGFLDRYAGKFTKVEYYNSEGGAPSLLEEALGNPVYFVAIVLAISASLVVAERYISKRRQ